MQTVISFYGSHNSALALAIDGKVECVLEAERFTNYKNGAISQYKVVNNPHVVMKHMVQWIQREYGIDEFDVCLSLNSDVNYEKLYDMRNLIPAKKYHSQLHHVSHAAGTFYQSNHPEALMFSFDGGGNDGMFNVYHATREEGPKLLQHVLNPLYNTPNIGYDLGFPYMVFGHYLNDIRHEHISDGNLVYPGKLMGLASYGKAHMGWLPHFMAFYKMHVNGLNYEGAIDMLGSNLQLKFDVNNRFEGQVAYDIAATSQRAFEECFLEVAKPYFEQYPDLPVGITGGCGLNIILNTRLATEFGRTVIVGPNPNDCGIAVGALLNYIKPTEAADVTYAGPPLLDWNVLGEYVQTGQCRELVDTEEYGIYFQAPSSTLLNDLVAGKIVGVARGRSEHGPRALGNRSILCNPSFPEMKDILNEKVKNREWYRPFAPVVRLEDVNKYFEWEGEARWMSFCPPVREEWRERLAAVTHVDNTARVQTVTHEQNPWLYDLLTQMDAATGVGVLLNTSFNVNGKPILSTIKDAIKIYTETKMDALLIENVYFRKEGFRHD
jgi:carbamoyltransferase